MENEFVDWAAFDTEFGMSPILEESFMQGGEAG